MNNSNKNNDGKKINETAKLIENRDKTINKIVTRQTTPNDDFHHRDKFTPEIYFLGTGQKTINCNSFTYCQYDQKYLSFIKVFLKLN